MKKIVIAFFIIATMALLVICCEKEAHIGGELSNLGEVGTEIRTDAPGVSNVDISIVDVKDGVSEFAGTMTVTNERFLKIMKKHPKYFDVNGNNVTVHDVKFKFTDQGIENQTGYLDGIVVRYDSQEGDKYAGGRKVTHVSTDNDYQWAMGSKIKVIEIEGKYNKDGVKTVKYWCNHRFGFVGFELEYTDGESDEVPIRLY